MTINETRRKSVWLGLFAVSLLLSGCKEVLYSDIVEYEANEMVAVLDAGGISAGREQTKDGTYNITVDGALVASAVNVLQASGYPRQRFESLGDVFADDGLVGSPFTERARFMHAMNEELARTISEIEGVRSARVQVMIPAKDRYDPSVLKATASVALMYDERHDLSRLVPVIKSLVAHSVADLAYDDVAVALLPVIVPHGPAEGAMGATPVTRAMSVLGFDIPPLWLVLVLGVLGSSGVASALLLGFGGRRKEGGGA